MSHIPSLPKHTTIPPTPLPHYPYPYPYTLTLTQHHPPTQTRRLNSPYLIKKISHRCTIQYAQATAETLVPEGVLEGSSPVPGLWMSIRAT